MRGSSVFDPHSVYAWSIYNLSVITIIIMALIVLLIAGLVGYASWRFRASKHPHAKLTYGNRKLELVYTIIPILILVFLYSLTIRTMNASDPLTRHGDNIVVVGHQWWWEVRYPGTGIVTANEVHMPVKTPWLFGMESADVIHDFWVPPLGRKMDMVPGYHRDIWLAADKPGVYLGTCSEYCGREHAWMRIRVIAQTPAAFAQWEAEQEKIPPIPTSGDAGKGARYFGMMSCSNCHSIRGTAAQGKIGPDLTHLASRSTLAAGRLPNDPDDLAHWLKDPQKYKPGCHMPNLGLTDEQNRDLVAYLETLR